VPPMLPATQSATFPGLRALADLFATEAATDAQRAQLVASDAAGQAALAKTTQARALISLFEARIVTELMTQWQSAAPSLGAKFVGVLSPLNQTYAGLLQGADAFGVPSGFVPFVYRPEDVSKGATNFEQMAAIAQAAVMNEAALEGQFLSNGRAYDAELSKLQNEFLAIASQYDAKLKEACGAAIDADSMTKDQVLTMCRTSGQGTLGVLQGQVDQAELALSVAQSRIVAQKAKLDIDRQALAAIMQLKEEQIAFTQANGQAIQAIDFENGVLNIEEKVIDIASRADLWNGGAPLGEAVAEGVLAAAKLGLDQAKEQLQLGGQIEAQQISEQESYGTGMANLQKEQIDIAEATVELSQNGLQVVQAQLAMQNSLANVGVMYDQRARQKDAALSDPTLDPSYRLLEDHQALMVMHARSAALVQLDLSAKALQYELNMSIAGIEGAVLSARNSTGMNALSSCLTSIYNASRVAYGTPQDYVTTVSVRQLLGIAGPRTDEVTGQVLSEGDQFRALLLRNQNFDGHGGVAIDFATDLQTGNKLWSSSVCEDRIATVQAQLVGDFLGDNQAQINLSVSGGAIMRACDNGSLTTWSLGGGDGSSGAGAIAVIGAGVNTFGDSPPNTSLFGQSVARATWHLTIPGGADAPSNADVDISHIDDVVLKVDHKAPPLRNAPITIDVSCLGNVGQ
jgi:hypothetical protein